MAKLHNEIRIRQVNGIGAGQEGEGSKFAEGDVVYVESVGFKRRNDSAYNSGDATASWSDVAGGGGGGGLAALVDDGSPQLGATLDANGNVIDMGTNDITDTKVGQWDSAYTDISTNSGGYLDQAAVDIRANLRIGAANVSALNDVNYNGVTLDNLNGAGKVLAWNQALDAFVPVDQSAGGASQLNELSDVTINTPADGHILTHNGSGQFENLAFVDVASKKYEITESGGNYRITGPGLDGSVDNPDIYLVRGENYSFTNNAGASHPFNIENTNNTPYTDSGLADNSLSNGEATTWVISMSAPAQLQYQCSNHSGMKGDIYILDESVGTVSQLLEGNTEVTVTDSGANGKIELQTEGSKRWEITSSGHLLPGSNGNYDIGSADLKVRHLFLTDNSLYVGEAGKLTVRDESLALVKRRKENWPSGIPHNVGNVGTLNGYSAGYNFPDNDINIDWSSVTLEHWMQLGQSLNAAWTVDDILTDGDFEESDSSNTVKVSHQSTSSEIIKKFYVSVDTKDQSRYPEEYAAGHSSNAYYIDGYHAPELRLKKGKYRFLQKHTSNGGHPLAFLDTNAGGGLTGSGALDPHILKLDIDLEYGYFNSQNGSDVVVSSWEGANQAWNPVSNDFSSWGLNPSNVNGWEYYVDITIRDGTPREFYYVCGAHLKMGWKIINEDAQHTVLKSEVLDNKPDFTGGNVDYNIANDLVGKIGGRIIIDTDTEGDRVSLDLETLNQNNFQKTLNFEIQSVGLATPAADFTVKVYNSGASELKLNSYWNPVGGFSVNAGVASASGANLTIQGNQILVIWCDENKNVDPASCGWTYQIRNV